MDDAGSPVIGLIVFLILIIADAVLYGFTAALDNVNDSQIDKKLAEGKKNALWLKDVIENPYGMIHILQIMITFVSVTIGIFLGRLYGILLAEFIMNGEFVLFHAAGYGVCHMIVTITSVFLLVSIGIIAPQKIAMRKAEFWVFGLAGIVRWLVILFTPFGYLTEKLSNLIVRIFGLDPTENPDDVTEEEIISMVKEGQEQGILMMSEAEMIHNIFEFGDKDAKDIMTHRKNIVAVDDRLHLSEALEFMLERNNSRFPVYHDNIDNITGVVHIKDAMIQSRNPSMLETPVLKVPGLVRDISFIPETRSIESIFQVMQSKKNHMMIVVDEYGQTAGLVAMEDILEVIVGSILDEYDEEDTMITREDDGSFLMKGMTPLDEAYEALNKNSDLEDYDTLNGFLISLIGKIPEDHETFEVVNNGYLFQVLSVENKMIQAVRVTKAEGEMKEPTDITCQKIQSVVE